MKKLLLIAAALLFAAPAFGEDWQGMLDKLNRMKQDRSVLKRKGICCNNLAIEAYQRNDWNNAESWIKQAISNDKEAGYEKVAANMYMRQAIELYKQRSNRNFTGYMHRQPKLLAERALAYDRDRADAHLFIGDIEYENQKLRAAKKAWLAAKKLDPSLPGIDKRLARVEREASVEKQFSKSSNSFFDIRYQHKNIDEQTAAGLRLAMTTARDQVGRDFAYRPKHKLNVLVYSSAEFSNLKLGPHWAGGLYDGKIRLPLDGKQNLKYAVATLFHEYTHAVIHDLARGNCPRWLNEGLSEIQGFKIQQESQALLKNAAKFNRLIPLEQLDLAFSSRDTTVVTLGYQQSHSLASYMVAELGYKRVKRLLEELGQEAPLEVALRKTCSLSIAELDTKWRIWFLGSQR